MGKKAPAHRGPDTPPEALSRRRRHVLYAALGATLLGLFMIYQSLGDATLLPPQPVAARGLASGAPVVPALPPASPARTVPATSTPDAHPTHLTIPSIGVDAPVAPLDLDSSNVLKPPPPDNTNLVGWYRGGTVPGDRGPAIVLGHVDTKTAPAVFWGLSTLTPGRTVDIARDDRVTATFTVDTVEVFSKSDFPDDRVYGQTPDAQLRLITCGGSYDKVKNGYTANVVVFAHLTNLRKT